MEGLKTSLESKFNQIFIEQPDDNNEENASGDSSSSKNKKFKSDKELQDLIEKARDYILSMNEIEDSHFPTENPQFLVKFVDSMIELIEEHGGISQLVLINVTYIF